MPKLFLTLPELQNEQNNKFYELLNKKYKNEKFVFDDVLSHA